MIKEQKNLLKELKGLVKNYLDLYYNENRTTEESETVEILLKEILSKTQIIVTHIAEAYPCFTLSEFKDELILSAKNFKKVDEEFITDLRQFFGNYSSFNVCQDNKEVTIKFVKQNFGY